VDNKQIRAAGRVAGKMAREAGKDWMPAVRNSGTFVKHVVPAAVKPLHSLWHEFLGFIFLLIAGAVAFKMWRGAATTSPGMMLLAGFLALVSAGYGISSILKARRISRS
jgi:predicted histidine transporter YuiF (NhaC family)